MADNQIEGLPEGATVGPPLQSQSNQVEGLPEGATVGPALQSSSNEPNQSANKEPKDAGSFSERHPTLSTAASALTNEPGPSGGPGMWTRAGQAVGLPTSIEEAKAAVPKLSV